ncbi:hypothetical protein CEP54_014499 [Fusarium duplospermum]|uniref:Uncharacterized protein n=1 Tax=Fusarium duplospermum TaxID=1325734 RepID=A0A428NVM8_9HYPO|nr:hypothetical protein CEP54_014499 [Fusarium duplospermum]
MTSTLAKLVNAHGFDQLFEVTPLPIPLAAGLAEVFTLEGDPEAKANEFMTAGDGATHVLVADEEDCVDFKWPDFTTVVERRTFEEAQFLDDVIRPPPKIVPHFGGTFRHTLENESPLYSATCMHREDAGLLSCNAVDAGYKIWLLPDREQTDLFEKEPLHSLKGHLITEANPLEEDYFYRDPEVENSDDNDGDDECGPAQRSESGARACTGRKATGELAYCPSRRARSAVYEVCTFMVTGMATSIATARDSAIFGLS